MSSSVRVVKVRYVSEQGETEELRKLHLPAAPPSGNNAHASDSYSDLSTNVRHLFNCKLPDAFTMQYLDDDWEWVTLSSGEELHAAILAQNVRPLVMIVFDQSKPLSVSGRQRLTWQAEDLAPVVFGRAPHGTGRT